MARPVNGIEIVDSREKALAIAERLAPVSCMSLSALYATLVEHLDAAAADVAEDDVCVEDAKTTTTRSSRPSSACRSR